MFKIDLYKKEVIKAFVELKSQNTLTQLQRYSRARLMKECLLLLEVGKIQKDIPFLQEMFNPSSRFDSLKLAIKDAGPDKFRPLQDFIQERTANPTDNVIEMLAIFIDFQPRPFTKWDEENKANKEDEDNSDFEHGQIEKGPSDKVGAVSTGAENTGQGVTQRHEQEHKGGGTIEEEEPEITEVSGTAPIVIDPPPVDPLGGGTDHDEQKEGESEITEVASTTPIIIDPQPVDPPEGATGHGEQKKGETEGNGRKTSLQLWLIFFGRNKFLYRSAAGVLLVVTSLISVYLLTPRQCMCWVDDHYEKVDCANKTQRNAVIPIDPDRLSFRKLTTGLCNENMQKIWYSKIDHEVEFFTGPGHHPVHTTRSLKAVTPYMWEKHAQCKPSL